MKHILRILFILMFSVVYAEGDIMVGDQAPDFILKDAQGVSHHLADYLGQDVVVYFYPKDDTPGCVKEACSIRDSYTRFSENNIKVFGVSYDGSASHQKFKEKYALPFSLLSDLDKTVAKRYGAAGLLLPKRRTFLINKQGVVFKVYESVAVTTHAADVLEAFDNYYSTATP